MKVCWKYTPAMGESGPSPRHVAEAGPWWWSGEIRSGRCCGKNRGANRGDFLLFRGDEFLKCFKRCGLNVLDR